MTEIHLILIGAGVVWVVVAVVFGVSLCAAAARGDER